MGKTHPLTRRKNTSKFWKFAKQWWTDGKKSPIPPSTTRKVNKQEIQWRKPTFSWFFPNNDDIPRTMPEQVKEIEKQIKNPDTEPFNSNFSMQELTRSLSQLPDKAMGLDRIHNRMLKNANTENRKSLLTTTTWCSGKDTSKRLKMCHRYTYPQTRQTTRRSGIV